MALFCVQGSCSIQNKVILYAAEDGDLRFSKSLHIIVVVNFTYFRFPKMPVGHVVGLICFCVWELWDVMSHPYEESLLTDP